MNPVLKALHWVAGEAWEKINVVATWRELKKLGKKYGLRFFIAALIWEIIEDVVFPLLSYYNGMPELIPVFLIFHFEVVTWPIFFWAFKTYDRARGLESPYPDRPVMSAPWRTALQVFGFTLAISGWAWVFLHNYSYGAMGLFVGLVAAFGFVHRRIWHDSNYGIRPDDTVELKRTLAQTVTHSLVSSLVLYSALKGFVPGDIPWNVFLGLQGISTALFLTLGVMWSYCTLGLVPCASDPPVDPRMTPDLEGGDSPKDVEPGDIVMGHWDPQGPNRWVIIRRREEDEGWDVWASWKKKPQWIENARYDHPLEIAPLPDLG